MIPTRRTENPCAAVRRRTSGWAAACALAAALFLSGPARAHNLDQLDTAINVDEAFIRVMLDRYGLGQTLIQDGDEFWMIFRTTPGPGTPTGVGGYLTFYIPTNYVDVLEVSYLGHSAGAPGDLNAPTNFLRIPLKGQSIIAIGSGAIAPATTTNLIGLTLTNAFGQAENPVTGTGLHRGTIAGAYADTGVFFSRDPRTVYQSWAFAPTSGPLSRRDYPVVLKNNRGELVTPITRYDAEQLIAYGRADAPPIVDPNGRGNAPWGLANVVAGPESGYAWQFDLNVWLDTTNMPAAVGGVGPWNRIRYPGSQYAADQAGLISSALGYAGVDASGLGFALGVDPGESELPGDVNAVRISYGMLELGRPEYAGVRIRVKNAPAADCFTLTTDAFGGDAGGEDGGKDHEWRYYDPTVVVINPCTLMDKAPSDPVVRPGDSMYFTLTFVNSGMVAYTNVVLTDTLPTGLAFISADPAQTSGLNPLVWNLGIVGPNEIRQFRVYVRTASVGTFLNRVVATSGARVLAEGEAVVEVGYRALLRGEKTVTPDMVVPGGTVAYALTVFNDGGGPNSVPLVIHEMLPPGFRYVDMASQVINGVPLPASFLKVNSADPNRPTFTLLAGIAADNKLELRFNVQVAAAQPLGSYCNAVYLENDGKIIGLPPQACVTVADGQIGDAVYRDWDGDGAQDAGEEGLSNVTVRLYAGACPGVGAPIQSATSGANGAYLFAGLGSGSYCVAVATNTAPPDHHPTTANSMEVALALNQAYVDADFGFQPAGTGSIGDTVFNDRNGDGLFNGADSGIAGVALGLYEDGDGDGSIGSGDLLIGTTQTGPGGTYAFTGLATNLSYLVAADETDPDLAAAFSPDNFSATTPAVQAVPVLAGAYAHADFGYLASLPSSIGDRVFIDVNRDGTYDGGDVPLPGIAVALYRAEGSGPAIATTVSDVSGHYLFSGLAPDAYLAMVDVADPDLPIGLGTARDWHRVELPANVHFLTADFAFQRIIGKAVDNTFATTNDVLTYTLNVNYPGNEPLENARVLDPFPSGVTFLNANAGGVYGAYSPRAPVPGVEVGEVVRLVVSNTVADTYVRQDTPTLNCDAGQRVHVRQLDNGSRVGLMRFPLDAIPEGSAIVDASCNYNVQNVGNFGSLYAYRMLTDWTETGATWNTNGIGLGGWAGGSFGAGDYASAAYGPMGVATVGWKTNDVTALLQKWIEDGEPNRGIALLAATANTDRAEIYDREDPGLEPRLAVTYETTPSTTNSLSVSRQVMAPGETVTVILTLWSSSTIRNVTPVLEANSGFAVIGGPAEAVPADVVRNTPRTFTFTCTPAVIGELFFEGSASAEDGFGFVNSQSASVLVSTEGSSNTVTWVLGTNTAALPGSAYSSGTLPSVYAFQGKTMAFWRYWTPSNSWEAMASVIGKTDQGAGLAYDGSNTIYGLRGAGQKSFWGYSLSNNAWAPLQDAPQNVKWGGALVHLGGYVYAFRGDDKTDFWRYSPAANVWSNMAPAPGTVKEGGALAADGTSIYALRGDGSAMFWKYDVGANAWFALANAPANVKKGGALTWLNGDLYAFRGDDKADFWRYGAASQAWSRLADLPAKVLGGGALATDGRYVYAFGGDGKKSFWRYNPATGAWFKMKDALGNVSDGGALVFAKGSASSLREVFLYADRTLVGSGTVVTVTMELMASILQTNVSPSALAATTTRGASASWISGPSPTRVSSLGTNETAAFTWTYRIDSGTDVGSVVFSGSATNGAGQSFGTAIAGDVIVTPPLVFQVTVDSPIAVDRVENMAGLQDDSGAIPPAVSETVYTALAASIGDRVWADLDGDGVQDAGEPGIANVAVWLHLDLDNDGAIDVDDVRVAATRTDASGLYRFFGVAPGTPYAVAYDYATVPAGYLPTTAGNTNVPSKMVHDVGDLSAGQQYLVADFGLQPPGAASIGDGVWLDANANGIRDAGEKGLTNVAVQLYLDANANQTIDDGDLLLQTVATGTNGTYRFDGLNPNAFLVQADEGSMVASPYGGSWSLGSALALVGGANPHAVALATANEAYVGADFGYRWAGQIGDYVWWDNNRDQVADADEPPVAAAYVMLFHDANGNGILDLAGGDLQIGGTSVATDGTYLFKNLPPASYLVDVYEDSIGLDGPVPTTPYVRAVALDPGESDLTADFGYFIGARIEGTVFWDANRSRLFDAAEIGLSGVTVYLEGADTFGNAVSMATPTAGFGHYLFVAPAGDYALSYSQASVEAGHPRLREATTATNYVLHAYAGDEWHPRFDFGVDHAGRIGDTVFSDVDGSGGQTLGEPGLRDATVVLYDAATNALDFLRTDLAGNYQFIGLDDGPYFVQVLTNSLPSWVLKVPTADPTPPADSWGHAAVADGGTVATMDFGYPPLPEIVYYAVGGTVYGDADSNGLFGAGETGLSNVAIRVAVDTNNDGIAESSFVGTTDANGAYRLAGIPSNGTVTIAMDESTLPDAAYRLTGDPDGAPLTNVWTVAGIHGDSAALDFGYAATYGRVAGTVCLGDGNGLYDPERNDVPLALVGIALRYSGRDGILGTADDWVRTTETAVDGTYGFGALPPGYYSIAESPCVYFDLADADGGDPNVIYVHLALGEIRLRQDFEDSHWLGTAGAVYNASVMSSNEFIWTDKPNEQRVENPNAANADIRELRLFADASNFYVRIAMGDVTSEQLPYVAIGLDPRRSTNSAAIDGLGDDSGLAIGGDYFGGPAPVHYPARNIILHKVGDVVRAELFAFDGAAWYPPPSGWSASLVSTAGETLEFRIPRQDLMLAGSVTGRFTVASFLNTGLWANEGDSTVEIAPGTPDALDSVSIAPLQVNDGRLDVTAWQEDLGDFDVDFWVDVRFEVAGIAGNQVPGTPPALSPTNSAEVAAQPTLSWGASADPDGQVTGYFLEASTNSSFNGVDGTENGAIALRVNLPPTQTNFAFSTSATQYWWRVRARDTAGALSEATVQAFSIVGRTDVEGPVPTLVYVGTNLSAFLAGDFNEFIDRYGYIQTITDAELAQPSNRISFAIRWDDSSGVYATNWMSAAAGAEAGDFTWNIFPEDGRVSPNWDVGDTDTQTGISSEWITDQIFWGSNVSAVGNSAVVLTNWARDALVLTAYDENREYFLKLSAEDDNQQAGTRWTEGDWASGGEAFLPNWGGFAADGPNTSRNVTTNFPVRFTMRDDDELPPVAALGQGWLDSRSLLASNSTAGLEATRSGQAVLYGVYDGALLANGLTLLFNACDFYSGIQVGSTGSPATHTALSIGTGPRLANNIANYSSAQSSTSDTTLDTTVLAWHWEIFASNDVAELWGGDGSGASGATNSVKLTMWDNDQDRPNDQSVAPDVVFGYLQVLDDDLVGPRMTNFSSQGAAGALIATGFEEMDGWGLHGAGDWTEEANDGLWQSTGANVALDDGPANQRVHAGFDAVGDALQLPPVNQPGWLILWARLDGAGESKLALEQWNGTTWNSLGERAVVATNAAEHSWTIDSAQTGVALRLRLAEKTTGDRLIAFDNLVVAPNRDWTNSGVPLAWAAAEDAPTGDSGIDEYRVVALGGRAPRVATNGISVGLAQSAVALPTASAQGVVTGYVFAVDADRDRGLADRSMGLPVPHVQRIDLTPPTAVNMGVGGTNATTETVDDPMTQFDLGWSSADVGPDDPAHPNHPTGSSSDRNLLSPWKSYKIYYGTYDPVEIPSDDDPASATTGFIYTNFLATGAYTNWPSVTAGSSIADPSAPEFQPDYNALTNASQNRVRLYDLDFDRDYVVVGVGVDKAGNEGPAGPSSWATNNTIRFALIRGLLMPKDEALAAFPDSPALARADAATAAALYWIAAGATNAQGGYTSVSKDYDLIYRDAATFTESSTNVWNLIGTVQSNWFADDGALARGRGVVRFYRASYKNRWKSTNALGQAQRPMASEEVYALHNVVLSSGPNFVALHGQPYTNTLQGVFGGLENFPGGDTALSDSGATLVEFYSAGTNAPTSDQYWLNGSGRWIQMTGGDVTTNLQGPDFFSRGFSITLPDPLPAGYATTTAWTDFARTSPVPAMVWSPIVQVPTNGFRQVIHAGNRRNPVAPVYNLVALRLPVAAHPGQMRLLESGFVNGARGASDEIYTIDTATKDVLGGSTLYCDAAQVWRFVATDGLVPGGYFKPNDVIVVVSKNGGLGNSWTWTYHPAHFYALPTRWMGN